MRHTSFSLAVLLAAARAASMDQPPAPEPKTFDITASRFKFEPSTLHVTEGDRVVLRLRSADGTHGLSVKEFRAKRTIPKTGEVVTLEFVADKPGTFTFVCSQFCGGGHSTMKGRLIVAPREQ